MIHKGHGVNAGAAPARPVRQRAAVRAGTALRGLFDRIIGASSLVSNDAVLDVRDFAWTASLRANWQAIRQEALAMALRHAEVSPAIADMARGDRPSAPVRQWRSCRLWGHGGGVADRLADCPLTSAVVGRIPGLNNAQFAVLAPGTHVPVQRGVTKGLLTCHLGLIVPRDGDVRMRVDRRIARWAEGETLLFDDTYDHELWNESSGTRVILSIQVRRPLRQPGKWVADTWLNVIRRSALVEADALA